MTSLDVHIGTMNCTGRNVIYMIQMSEYVMPLEGHKNHQLMSVEVCDQYSGFVGMVDCVCSVKMLIHNHE